MSLFWSLPRRWLAGAAAGLLALSLAACGDESGSGSGSGEEKVTLGFVNADTIDFHTCLEKAMELEAAAAGAEIIVANSTRDPAKELANVEDMIVRNVDAIILQTVNIDSLEGSVEKANAAGIPIFLTSVLGPDPSKILGAILADVEQSGRFSGEWLSEDADGEPVKAAIIAGAPGAASDLFVKGFKEALSDNVEVVFEQPGMFQRAKAQEVAENLLQSHPEVEYVFVPNEEMAFGALTAFETANRSDIKILTHGGSPAGLEALQEGKFVTTVSSTPKDIGHMAVEATLALLENPESVEKIQQIPTQLVTADNIEDARPYCDD